MPLSTHLSRLGTVDDRSCTALHHFATCQRRLNLQWVCLDAAAGKHSRGNEAMLAHKIFKSAQELLRQQAKEDAAKAAASSE